jgi:hypothetical protein
MQQSRASDPWTLDDLSNIPNTDPSVFVFNQNKKRYKFLTNSVLKAYKLNRNDFRNPLTRQPLNNKTIQRIRDLKNTSKNTLTRNEEEFMEGIHALYQMSKSTRMTYNRLADEYINDIVNFSNNPNQNRINLNRTRRSLKAKGKLT